MGTLSHANSEHLTIPSAEFVNQLAITGHLSAKARGKELVIGICNSTAGNNFIFRIAFGLEAHCFWILTQWYSEITSAPTIRRGECSHAYALPDCYVQGPENPKQCISIQAAFIRPNWTLIFVDHNIMIQFHLIFGPPWGARAMDLFTTKSLQPHSLLSIPGILKFSPNPNTQTVFNGRGAQEATDLLILALIHPQMPTVYVCRDDITWARFRQAFIDYDKSRTDLVLPRSCLPHVSGPSPIRMNTSGHKKFLSKVSGYKHGVVIFTEDQLNLAHELGLS
ncbi:hypothetical protein B0H17DRAFT_1139801 [Mycena rosella]|uniref:Uncharacterized protein n=1 Tax=Mycena rosella TaxID=1033263 RepID=A0AAD7D4N1_MYCRO|nr:hypothetical protein B0H17DRAFT_1139801 [Mycena rosella]